MDALLGGRGGDLRGREPDSLVDDVHTGVAGAHSDLFGAVGMAVQPGLADEELETTPERLAQQLDLLAQLCHLLTTDGGGLAYPGRGAVLAERLAERLRPLPGGGAGAGGGDRGRHDVLAVV